MCPSQCKQNKKTILYKGNSYNIYERYIKINWFIQTPNLDPKKSVLTYIAKLSNIIINMSYKRIMKASVNRINNK